MPFEKGNKLGRGRPKKEFCIPDILREIGQEQLHPDDKRTKLRAVLDRVYIEALDGQSWAAQFIADRTEGKPIQQVISENENTVRVERTIKD